MSSEMEQSNQLPDVLTKYYEELMCRPLTPEEKVALINKAYLSATHLIPKSRVKKPMKANNR